MIKSKLDTSLVYNKIRELNKPRVLKHWHASSISECPRAHYFMRLGIPTLPQNLPTGAKILRWDGGHALETAIRPVIEALYPLSESNNRLTSKELDLTGEYDNLVGYEKLDTIVEIKSVHDYAFITRDNNDHLKEEDGLLPNGNRKWKIRKEPYLNHILQQHCYVLLLAEKGIEVKYIDYIYISLSGRLVTFHTEVDTKYLDNVKARLKALNEAWKTKIPPVCICHSSHELWASTMQYCDYRDNGKCCDLKLIKGE